MRRFGWRAFYGDATRLDLLRTAGAASARVLVLAIDDVAQSLKVAALAREHFPALAIVARARNVQHYMRLRELGVALIERETLDGREVEEIMAHGRILTEVERGDNDPTPPSAAPTPALTTPPAPASTTLVPPTPRPTLA